MRSSHVPMTLDEFELLPQKPGWKYEYADGLAHITPSNQIAVVSLQVRPSRAAHSCLLRPLSRDDQVQLIELFIASFTPAMEYCDWTTEDIQQSAADTVCSFFSGRRGTPLPASRTATWENETVGATLIVSGGPGRAILDAVFVAPSWQRKGLASALVRASINDLHRAEVPVLLSAYMLGNESSQAWHRAVGFIEEPDLLLARSYLRLARYELERSRKLGADGLVNLEDLERACEHWHRSVEQLEAVAQERGMETVIPLLRYSRRG